MARQLSKEREREIRVIPMSERAVAVAEDPAIIDALLAEIDRLRELEQLHCKANQSLQEVIRERGAEIDRLRADLDKTARDAITYLREKSKAITALETISDTTKTLHSGMSVNVFMAVLMNVVKLTRQTLKKLKHAAE